MFTDHTGKTSQSRICSLIGTLAAAVMCVATVFGAPEPRIEIIISLLGVPGGYSLWQKGVVESSFSVDEESK